MSFEPIRQDEKAIDEFFTYHLGVSILQHGTEISTPKTKLA